MLPIRRQPVKLGQIAPQSYTYLSDLSFIGTAGFASTSWFQVDSAANITAQHGDLLAFDLLRRASAIDIRDGS